MLDYKNMSTFCTKVPVVFSVISSRASSHCNHRALHLRNTMIFSRPVLSTAYVRSLDGNNIRRNSYGARNRSKRYRYTGIDVTGISTVAALLIGGTVYWLKDRCLLAKEKPDLRDLGGWKKNLPTYDRTEIAKHRTVDSRVWVTYKNGVYDITHFLKEHPGGSSKIMLAAGGDLEPFWNLYAIHNDNQHVSDILADLRIGNVEAMKREATASSGGDPFSSDPPRSPLLIPSAMKPFNAEPPSSILIDNFHTPNDVFFVRNHLPVPKVDADSFRLSVGYDGGKTRALSLDTIRRSFKKKTISSTIQCAGNRRSEFNRHKTVKGNNWNVSAISTAEWSGAMLGDMLKYCGVDINDPKYRHVKFEGLDRDMTGERYGASIPIEVARKRIDDILIAYEMNGEALSRDHGYPLRVILPGCVGARQVKWLCGVSLSTDESGSHWQQLDYKGFNPSLELRDLDYSKSTAITDLPVTSAICEPADGQVLDADSEFVVVKGYAWSGGGHGILRVDVSCDGGRSWHEADLTPNGQNMYSSWAWTLWEAVMPIEAGTKSRLELVCKATDVGYNVQPDSVSGVWNPRGVLNNAWHRVVITKPT